MDKNRFFQSWFQLADQVGTFHIHVLSSIKSDISSLYLMLQFMQWTDDLKASSYITFLSNLIKCMVKLNDVGKMEWCDIDKVCELSAVSAAMEEINSFVDDLKEIDVTTAQTLISIIEDLDGQGVLLLANFLKTHMYNDTEEGMLSIKHHFFLDYLTLSIKQN